MYAPVLDFGDSADENSGTNQITLESDNEGNRYEFVAWDSDASSYTLVDGGQVRRIELWRRISDRLKTSHRLKTSDQLIIYDRLATIDRLTTIRLSPFPPPPPISPPIMAPFVAPLLTLYPPSVAFESLDPCGRNDGLWHNQTVRGRTAR